MKLYWAMIISAATAMLISIYDEQDSILKYIPFVISIGFGVLLFIRICKSAKDQINELRKQLKQ